MKRTKGVALCGSFRAAGEAVHRGSSAEKTALLFGSVLFACAFLLACAYCAGADLKPMKEAVGSCMQYVGVI